MAFPLAEFGYKRLEKSRPCNQPEGIKEITGLIETGKVQIKDFPRNSIGKPFS
jgi:hypothetical protein